MAFIMKGITPYNKNQKPTTSPLKDSEWGTPDSNMSEAKAYLDEMKRTGRSKGVIQGALSGIKGPIYFLRMQKKWGKFASGFSGGPSGPARGYSAMQAAGTPAGRTYGDSGYYERVQKSIGDELMQKATRFVQPQATTAGIAAQGMHLETIYNSTEFQRYLRREMQRVIDDGKDPKKIQWDLWKGYDFDTSGRIKTGDELNARGVSHQRQKEWEGMNFRDPSPEEKAADMRRTGGRSMYATKSDHIKAYLGIKDLDEDDPYHKDEKTIEKIKDIMDEEDL